MGKLGNIGDRIGEQYSCLLGIRDSLRKHAETISEDRWSSVGTLVSRLVLATEQHDIIALYGIVGSLKNKLRRPYMKNALAEAKGENRPGEQFTGNSAKSRDDYKDEVTGRCAQCGKPLDGEKEEHIKGTLCVSCALKKKVMGRSDPVDVRNTKRKNRESERV